MRIYISFYYFVLLISKGCLKVSGVASGDPVFKISVV